MPFADIFCAVISFGASKSSSEIFHAGANVLGCSPEQCVYVGNHSVNDYQGAKASGMQAIWLEGFHKWPEHLCRPAHRIRSLDELIPILLGNMLEADDSIGR
ncbi:dUMP phosphatase [compost metagenome]